MNRPSSDPGCVRFTLDRVPLQIQLSALDSRRLVARAPLLIPDLAELCAEAWLRACLRLNYPGLAFAEAAFTLVAHLGRSSGHPSAPPAVCDFQVEVGRPDGTSACAGPFPVGCLAPAAANLAAKVGWAEPYSFAVTAEAAPPLPLSPPPAVGRVSCAPMAFLSGSVPRLRQHALADSGEITDYPVFFTAAAFADAEQLSRTGATRQPSVETGCLLMGSLGLCPETQDLFVLVSAALPVPGAIEEPFALHYTDETWLWLRAILRSRRQSNPAERLLGQAHGHSFLPGNCLACSPAVKAACSATSVFLSPDDLQFHRSVFVRQPWGLSLIFGLARDGSPCHALFALRGGSMQRRGFALLDPALAPTRLANLNPSH